MKNDIYEISMLSTILKKAASAVICASFAISAGAQMQMQTDTWNGGISILKISVNAGNMDWLITGDGSYRKRAENIVRNNLCLFKKDGHASCAYLYPYKVDGVKGKFYDGYANDQDWALYYYLMVNDD